MQLHFLAIHTGHPEEQVSVVGHWGGNNTTRFVSTLNKYKQVFDNKQIKMLAGFTLEWDGTDKLPIVVVNDALAEKLATIIELNREAKANAKKKMAFASINPMYNGVFPEQTVEDVMENDNANQDN